MSVPLQSLPRAHVALNEQRMLVASARQLGVCSVGVVRAAGGTRIVSEVLGLYGHCRVEHARPSGLCRPKVCAPRETHELDLDVRVASAA